MTVNIFRQKVKVDGGKLPVAVYIHGGAFNRGSGEFSLCIYARWDLFLTHSKQ